MLFQSADQVLGMAALRVGVLLFSTGHFLCIAALLVRMLLQSAPEPAVPEGPICGKEPHTHGEGCYEDAIVCGFAEEHAHGEGCATQTLACTVAEHAHGDGCTVTSS